MKNILWLFFDMGSTLIDESRSYKVWFQNASDVVDGALSAEEIEREYSAGMVRGNPTVAGQLKPYGFEGNSTSSLYPSDLDRPYPQAKAVLRELSKRYKLGVIANQNAGAQERLHSYGIAEYFDVVISSFEAGVSKPDGRIFLLALEQAGCAAQNAAMIGDRPDNDICPAKALGFTTVRIMQGYGALQCPEDERYKADFTVNTLEELLQIF